MIFYKYFLFLAIRRVGRKHAAELLKIHSPLAGRDSKQAQIIVKKKLFALHTPIHSYSKKSVSKGENWAC